MSKATNPRLGAAALATYGTQILVSTLALVSVVVTARTLGAEGRGEIVFLFTVAGLLGFCFTFSAQEALANAANSSASEKAHLAGGALVLAVLFGLAGMVAGWVLVRFVPFLRSDANTLTLFIALGAIPLAVLQNYFVYMVRAMYSFGLANASMLASAVWTIGWNLALALTHNLTVRSAVIVWTTSQVLVVVILGVRLFRAYGTFSRPSLHFLRASVAFGGKAHLAGIMNTGSYKLDQWLLGALSGPAQLGIYSVAVSWFEGLFLLPGALAMVARPAIVDATDPDASHRAAQMFRAGLLSTALIGTVLAIVAPILCGGLFGDEFEESSSIIRILVPGALGIVAVKILGGALTARGKPMAESAGVAPGFALGVVLYALLIPAHGATGAAIATTIAYSTSGIATVIVYQRSFHASFADLVPGRADAAMFMRSITLFVNRLRDVNTGRAHSRSLS